MTSCLISSINAEEREEPGLLSELLDEDTRDGLRKPGISRLPPTAGVIVGPFSDCGGDEPSGALALAAGGALK